MALSKKKTADFPLVTPRDRAAWRRWLSRNYRRSQSIWLVLYKKGSGRGNLTAAEACEEALCFGWIDSRPGKIDATKYKLLLSPRRPGSGWSKINRDRVKTLLRSGKMAPPGLAKIEAAKKDGSWSRLAASDRLKLPSELRAALRARPKAKERFDAFPPSSRRAILEWIFGAKTTSTRQKRIAETARLAAEGLRANYSVDLERRKARGGK